MSISSKILSLPLSKSNKIKYTKIIYTAMKDLNISFNLKTNPNIIIQILKEMNLYEFNPKYKPIQKFLKNAKKKPQKLISFFKDIKKGLINQNPALLEFLEISVKNKWLQNSIHTLEAIHYAYILEALTAAMSNNNNFAIELEKYLLYKRKKYGIKNHSFINTFWNIYKITKNSFDAIKTISIDPAIKCYRYIRSNNGEKLTNKNINQLYKNKKINYLDYKILFNFCNKNEKSNYGIILNIAEAEITEYKNNFKNNAYCAHALNEEIKKNPVLQKYKKIKLTPKNTSNKFYREITNKNNFILVTPLSQDWVNLYNSWNMAFVIGNFNDIKIILPKLFIPSIINAKKENYMFTRVISLWLTINIVMYRKFENVKEQKEIKNKNKMAQTFGEINKKYAINFSKKYTKMQLKELNISFNEFFSKPEINFIKILLKI